MSDYWLRRALADEARAHRLAAETSAELKKLYQRQYKRTYAQLERLYGQIDWGDTLTRTQLWQYKSWRSLEKQLRQFATETPRIGIDKITGCLDKVFKETIGRDIGMYGGGTFGHDDVALSLINTAWSGETFSARIWKNTAAVAERIRSDMEDMLIGGRSREEIKLQLMKDFSVSYRDASRLVETETAYVLNGAEKQRYKDAGIQKIRWSIRPEDGKECALCKSRADKVWHIENAPMMPAHPRCRCIWVGVIELPGENVPCTGEGEEASESAQKPSTKRAEARGESTKANAEARRSTAETSAMRQNVQAVQSASRANETQAPARRKVEVREIPIPLETAGKAEAAENAASAQAEIANAKLAELEAKIAQIKEKLDKSGNFDKIDTGEFAKIMAKTPEIPDAKIYKYMLDPEKKHYRDFLEAGYVTAADGERLREDILRLCEENDDIQEMKWDDEHKLVKYNQYIRLGKMDIVSEFAGRLLRETRIRHL